MRRHRPIRAFCMMLLLCICCVVVMKVLAFDINDESTESDKGEETIVGWMIDRIAAGEIELSDEDSIRQAISEGEKEFGVSLSEENRDRLVGFMMTLDSIEDSADDFIEQAGQMYQKFSAEFVEQANDTINGALKDAAKDAVRSFFESLLSKKDE